MAHRADSVHIGRILLFLLVVTPNLVLSAGYEGLVHDDSTQMALTRAFADKNWYGVSFFLNSLRENVLFHIATFASPLLARVLICFVYLGGSALLLESLLRSRFGLPGPAAAFASAAPFLVPALWQIPLGVNISYVAGDVFFSLLAAHLILFALSGRLATGAWIACLFALYVAAAELQPSATVTVPILLALAASYGPARIVRRLPVLGAIGVGFAMAVLGELEAKRRTAVGLDEFASNYVAFWAKSIDVVAPSLPSAVWLALAAAASLAAAVALAMILFAQARRLAGARPMRVLRGSPLSAGAATLVAWLLWSPVPYTLTATSAAAATYDRYYFVWQIAFWIAFAIGAHLLLVQATRQARRAPGVRALASPSRVSATVLGAALVLLSVAKALDPPADLRAAQSFIRPFKQSLNEVLKYDRSAQLLVLLERPPNAAIPHVSNPWAGTGYLSYLLHRDYAHAVIGKADVCSAIFDPLQKNWGYYEVSGFSEDASMRVLRYDRATRSVQDYARILDFDGPAGGRLLDISATPRLVARFEGTDGLRGALAAADLAPEDVAFAERYLAGECQFIDRSFK